MESQLKAMRVPELKELASKAGVNVPAKSTKDKIIALLMESTTVSSLLGGEPAQLSQASAPAAPTVGAPPTSAAAPAHAAKAVEVKDATPAAANAYGSTAASATAVSAPTAGAEPAVSQPEIPTPTPEAPLNPLEGSSKPVAGTTGLTEEERRAARKARFQREWDLDHIRKDAEAAAKAAREEARAKEVAAKKGADGAEQGTTTPAGPAAAKTNGSAGQVSSDVVEKRKARFAQGGGVATATTPAAFPTPAAAPLLTGADAEKAAARKNKFASLVPGQPGYGGKNGTDASPKRPLDESAEAPAAKKIKA